MNITEKVINFLQHLPTCNKMQDWSEAHQAMSDTPKEHRDWDWDVAYNELLIKQSTCTCSMNNVLKEVNDIELSLLEARKAISEAYHSDFWKTDVGKKINDPIKDMFYRDK